MNDVTVQILCIAAIIPLGIGAGLKKHREEYGYLEGIAIVVVVCVVVFLQAYIDYVKELKFRQLNSIKDNYMVKVVRDGEVHAVTAGEVMVGDLVELVAGDKVPADGIFVEGSKFKANEAAMTGEPIDISKDHDKDPFMLSGTSISEGSGRMIVVAVGSASQWGVILKTLIVEPSSTPLQDRLDILVVTVGNFGIGAAILTFIASLIRWIVDGANGKGWEGLLILEYLINSVTIVVVAIPEGLPLAITLGLAFAMRKMMADQNLVRRLEACETMGSATQLNADKTGTLTQSRHDRHWPRSSAATSTTRCRRWTSPMLSRRFSPRAAASIRTLTSPRTKTALWITSVPKRSVRFCRWLRICELQARVECPLQSILRMLS